MIHTVQGLGIVSKEEIDVFLELSCFFHDPADVGNLISGSSAFSKISLNIWKFAVHVLLKPGLENFEHYLTSMRWGQLWGSLKILGHCLCGIGMKTDLFQSCGHCQVFQICWRIECRTVTASSFRIWNNPPVNECRLEEINTTLSESGWNQEIFATMYHCWFFLFVSFYFTSSTPHLCYIKETSFQPSKPKMILWDPSPPSWSVGFPNKVTTTFSKNLLPHLLACHVASSMSLNPVTSQVYFSYCGVSSNNWLTY